VIIFDEAGGEIARGLVRYDAEDAARIRGLKSEAIEPTLGYTAGPVVHADDLALADAREPG
jgi:glutamate 5-kinase